MASFEECLHSIWSCVKLGGRDDQYSPAKTGMEPHRDAPRTASDRDGWKPTVDADTPARRTLQLVIEAVKG